MDPGVGAPRGGFADLPDRYADLPGQTKPPNLTVPAQTYYCAPPYRTHPRRCTWLCIGAQP